MSDRIEALERNLTELRKRQREDYNQVMGALGALQKSMEAYQDGSLRMLDYLHGALTAEISHRDGELTEIRQRLDRLENPPAA